MIHHASSGSAPVRRLNLSALFRLVHTSGPISRAELTRATGLNRSTVGALLAELIDCGRVRAGDPAPDRAVGRPSPMISPSENIAALTVYPDTDAIEFAVVGMGGNVRRLERRDMPKAPTPQDTVGATARVLEQLPKRMAKGLVGIGVAVPGLVRTHDGFVHLAPHIPWREVPISDLLAQATDLPAFVRNDAALGLHAEAIFGAGRTSRSIVYLHGGSGGIGSGVQLGPVPNPDDPGYLPELGHVLVDPNGEPCRCGATGCLEAEVSYARILQTLDSPTVKASDLPRVLTDARGKTGAEVQRQRNHLVNGVRNAVNAFTPELVILGGFLGTLFDLDPEGFTSSVRGVLMEPLAEVQIRRGTLGSSRIHIGAADLAFEPLLQDPCGSPDEIAR